MNLINVAIAISRRAQLNHEPIEHVDANSGTGIWHGLKSLSARVQGSATKVGTRARATASSTSTSTLPDSSSSASASDFLHPYGVRPFSDINATKDQAVLFCLLDQTCALQWSGNSYMIFA